jgi:hypothetical protein
VIFLRVLNMIVSGTVKNPGGCQYSPLQQGPCPNASGILGPFGVFNEHAWKSVFIMIDFDNQQISGNGKYQGFSDSF